MKKFGFLCITALTCISLAACGNTSLHKSSAASHSSSKVVKKHHKNKKNSKSTKSSKLSNSSSSSKQQSKQSENTQQSKNGRPLTQGEINRQRGYDPNGAPLLPGQDHAAGSNPDGSPDAWVQWQLDHQNDKTYPDGTPLPNGGYNGGASNTTTNQNGDTQQ